MAGREIPFPTRDQVLEFVRDSDTPVGRREIARAFHIRGADRAALRALLRELEEEGLLGRPRHRRYGPKGALPPVTVIEITGTDADGEVLARPEGPDVGELPPVVYLKRWRGTAPGAGDRMLARLRRLDDKTYEAAAIRRLEAAPRRVLGVYVEQETGGRIRPTDRRVRQEVLIAAGDSGGARDGDLVHAVLRPEHRFGLPHGRVIERLGSAQDPGAASLIALHGRGIPDEFPRAALDQAAAAGAAPVGRRTDLRDIPLVTIDDADARDFDDAIWAEPDSAPDNEGGWHLLVAIADVAWYVRPDDALDRSARERGNSIYLPDRVVPMLPEALSNVWCSLRPDEERPCIAVHIWIDAAGTKRRHRFVRGTMRSAARLTYDRVQVAIDGEVDDAIAPLLDSVIRPIYGAYGALRAARDSRGTIDLDLPERRVVLNDDGTVNRIELRPRYDSHRVIEEFMIAANVCAAETLEQRRQPCMYRIHDQPSPAKLEALRELLGGIGYRLAKGQVLQPRHFNRIVQRAKDTPESVMVNEAILRSQAQAAYDPENIGHFGLALRRYAHFTSPIRRYSDLLVHRALIAGLGLGKGGLGEDAAASFAETAQHISMTERRAIAAERDAVDRLTAAYLAVRVGAEFQATINGVARFGLFVTLVETGAGGLVPMSSLGDERFRYDERSQTISGARLRLTLGDTITVCLEEADQVTGSLAFRLVDGAGRVRRQPATRRRGAKTGRRGGKRK